MTESPAVRHFDHHSDPDLLADPYEVWARIRETTPSFLSTAGPRRIWYVTRYEDVRAAAEQPDLFSSRSILPFEADSERPNLIPEEMDSAGAHGVPAGPDAALLGQRGAPA